LINIHFKNVGQGDSIILEWTKDDQKCIGIIDCHVYNGANPTLDYLKKSNLSKIDFIILSHFHYDHFSGFADLFTYCINNKISVKCFYHSLAPFLGEFYNRVFTSQKIKAAIKNFFETYDLFDEIVEDKVPVSSHVRKLELASNTYLSFLAPRGKMYDIMARQLSRKVNKIVTTAADPNKLSTIILIENQSNCALLTADAVTKSFAKQNITSELVLAQVPHHGSWGNVNELFWRSLKKVKNCPAIFSVGDEPKDKLPNVETVSFFNAEGFDIYATNEVYGIAEFVKSFTTAKKNSSTTIALNTFSILKKTYSTSITLSNPHLNGDQTFAIL